MFNKPSKNEILMYVYRYTDMYISVKIHNNIFIRMRNKRLINYPKIFLLKSFLLINCTYYIKNNINL